MDGFHVDNAVIFDGPTPLKVASNLALEPSSRFERLLELLKHPQEHEEVCSYCRAASFRATDYWSTSQPDIVSAVQVAVSILTDTACSEDRKGLTSALCMLFCPIYFFGPSILADPIYSGPNAAGRTAW